MPEPNPPIVGILTFGHRFQIEGVDVKDTLEGMSGVGGDVRLVSQQSALVQEVVLLDELLELRLKVGIELFF